MRIAHAAQLERMSAQYREENKRLSDTIENLQGTMQQLMANMRVTTTTMSTSAQDEDGFIESPSRETKTGKKSSLQNAIVPYSSQPKITATEQEESAKREGRGSPARQSRNSNTSNSPTGMSY